VKAPCTVAATIKLPASSSGTYPVAAAFDPQNNYVFVTDADANAVYVISGTKIVTTLHGFDGPEALVYDPCATYMIVTNFASDNLTTVFNTTTRQSIPVGMGPDGIGYDAQNSELVVANYYGGNVTLIDACSLVREGNVGVGSNPEGVAYDPAFGLTYLTNFGSGNVTVLYDGGVYDRTGGFDEPSSATWSQAKLAVYVTNYGSGKLWAIGGTSPYYLTVQKISIAKGIDGSTYDDANNDIYVTDSSTGILYVYST
jgi:DNA-binding beta-propeller fold protein YncE